MQRRSHRSCAFVVGYGHTRFAIHQDAFHYERYVDCYSICHQMSLIATLNQSPLLRSDQRERGAVTPCGNKSCPPLGLVPFRFLVTFSPNIIPTSTIMLRHSARLQSQSIWRATASSPSCGHHQMRRVVLNATNALKLCESPSARTHLQQRHLSNSSKNPPSSTTTRSSFTVRQRKNNTWLPQWQTLILSDTDSTSPNKSNIKKTEKAFRPTEQRKDGSDPLQDEVGIAKYLLSPQTTLAVFLPKGFPESVTPNYWPFAKWQFAHNVAGSVTAGEKNRLICLGLIYEQKRLVGVY